MQRKVDAWLRQADIDLRTAERLVDDADLTPSTAFHCQQCVEKCFKALIEHRDMNVPRTDDLHHLLGAAMGSYELQVDKELLGEVNEVYVDSRYPGDAGLVPEGKPSLQKARAFVAFARDIHDRTRRLLS